MVSIWLTPVNERAYSAKVVTGFATGIRAFYGFRAFSGANRFPLSGKMLCRNLEMPNAGLSERGRFSENCDEMERSLLFRAFSYG
jgi:hypothetical protein